MRFALALSLCLLAGLAHAQSRITVALDGSFVRTTWGPPIKLGGATYFGEIAFHKVVQHKGRAYACVAVTSNSSEFATRSRVVTAQGAVVRRDLRGWTYLAQAMNISRTIEVPSKAGSGTRSVRVFPGSLRKYAGTPVSCRVSHRTPNPEFFTGDTRLVIPERIWVRRVY